MSDKALPEDRGETSFSLEPLFPEEASRHRPYLLELSNELTRRSASLSAIVPSGLRGAIGQLMLKTNGYYSNLIEGHDLHPVLLERALRAPPGEICSSLELEGMALLDVQEWIDTQDLTSPLSISTLLEIHHRLCDGLPQKLLTQLDHQGTPTMMVPGALRRSFVKVGDHIAPSPGAIVRLLNHLDRMYRMQGRQSQLIAIACLHHRLAWVHPFADLNGRVLRLVTQAMLKEHLNHEVFWSLARGLARDGGTYHARMSAADTPRTGGADGRGALSEARLAEFAAFFLKRCIEEADLMTDLLQPKQLHGRVDAWAASAQSQGHLPASSGRILTVLFSEGQIDRRAVGAILDREEQDAQDVVERLLDLDVLKAEPGRASYKLNLPASLTPALMPGLLPAR